MMAHADSMIDPRYQQIMDALPSDYDAQERFRAADALYAAVSGDPTIKRVDQIARKAIDAMGEEKLFAMYRPHGDLPPSFMVAAVVDRGSSALTQASTPLVDSRGYLTDSSVSKSPIAALENGKIQEVHAIVLHRTDSTTLESTLAAFRTGVGTHFVIDKDGTIHQTASLLQQTAHVGKIKSRCDLENTCSPAEDKLIDSKGFAPKWTHDHEKLKPYPDRYPVNSDSIGIEVVSRHTAQGWEQPTPQQAASIARLVSILERNYGLEHSDVYQHDKISYKTAGEGAGLWQAPAVQPDPGAVERMHAPAIHR